MPDSKMSISDKANILLSSDKKLQDELRELGRKNHPEFYKNYDDMKNREKYLERSEATKESKNELVLLKDILKNFSILEEILMTGTSNRLNKLSYFHKIKPLEILITFYQGDLLDLSGLKKLNNSHAEVLKDFKGTKIDLSGLVEIDRETYLTLCKYPGEIIGIDYPKPSK